MFVRLAPLTGVVFAIMSAVTIVLTPASPSASASGAKVIAFYTAHATTEKTTIIIAMIALCFFMFFASVVRGYIRECRPLDGLAALVLAAATLFSAGLSVSAGFAFGLADVGSKIGVQTAQTMNMLDEEVYFTMELGAALFLLAAGIAILRGAPLPKWLGWASVVVGLVTLAPPLFAIGLIGLSLWSLLVGIIIYRRQAASQVTSVTAITTA